MRRETCLLLALLLICVSAGTAGSFEEITKNDPLVLPGMIGAANGGGEEQNTFQGTLELAASGRQIWRVQDGELLCADLMTGEETGTVLLADLPEEAGFRSDGAKAEISFCNLGSFQDGALLCMNWQEDGTNRTALFHLRLKDHEIEMVRAWDVTERLETIFDGKTAWYEVNMAVSGEAVYFGALDSSFVFRQFLYMPDEDRLLPLEDQPLMLQCAVFPWQGSFMMLQFSLEEENAFELLKLDASTGEMTRADTMRTGSSDQPMNLASDPADHTVFFTVSNSAYRYTVGSGGYAEPFAVFPEIPVDYRLSLVTEDCYVVQSEKGTLMPVNVRSEFNAVRLNVGNIAADDSVTDLSAFYNLQHPESYVAVTDGGEESAVLDDMLSGSARYDLYVVSMNTEAYTSLISRGYMADLSESGALKEIAGDFTPSVRNEIFRDGKLYAMPLYTENRCLQLNTEVLAQTAGISPESIPTNWPGFLAFVAQLSRSGVFREDGEYCFGEPGKTPESFREQLLAWILSDCCLWVKQEESNLSLLPQVLTPILKVLEEIDFDGLGLAKEEAEDLTWFFSNQQKGILTEGYLEIETGTREPGTVFWPLSMTADGERLIPQEIAAVFVNPYSEHPELARSYVEYVWENMDVLRKMSFCGSLNEPVVNTAYDEDVAYLEAMIPEYEAAIAGSADPVEAAMLSAELEGLQAELTDYRENGHWYASEESIAAYRAAEDQLRPAAPIFWSADEEDQAVLQYLDGMISAELFVQQLQSAMRMHRMELE